MIRVTSQASPRNISYYICLQTKCSKIINFDPPMRINRYYISTLSKVVFFGSDNFAYHPLMTLHQHFPHLTVVTHHTQSGVKVQNKVASYCSQNGIDIMTPIHKVAKEERTSQWNEFHNKIKDQEYSLGIICSYGYMIPAKVIKSFSRGMIVVHPSLLPKYRGGAPIYHAVANGDSQSGISYIEVSKGKFDAGNILYQSTLDLPQDQEYSQIEELLSLNAADRLPYVLHHLEQLRPGKPQGSEGVSSAPISTSKHVDFSLPSTTVYNLSRAIKGGKVKFENKDMILKLKQQFCQLPQPYLPGTVFKKGKKAVFVTCGDNQAVRLDSFKQPSKVFFPATVFLDKYLRKEPFVMFQ